MKTTSPLNYYQALNLCTDKSGQTLREWMNSPFIAGQYAGASDSYSLLYFPKERVSNFSLREIEFSKISGILIKPNIDYPIQLQTIKDAIAKAPLIDEYTEPEGECPYCDGEGVVECSECGNEYDCKKCDGTGYLIRSKPTGNKIPNDTCLVQLGNGKISMRLLMKLAKIADILEANQVNIVYDDLDKYLFRIDEAYFLAMKNIGSDKPVATINYVL